MCWEETEEVYLLGELSFFHVLVRVSSISNPTTVSSSWDLKSCPYPFMLLTREQTAVAHTEGRVISRTKKLTGIFLLLSFTMSYLVGDLHFFFHPKPMCSADANLAVCWSLEKFWQLAWTKLYFLSLDSIRQLTWQVLPSTQWKMFSFFSGCSALNGGQAEPSTDGIAAAPELCQELWRVDWKLHSTGGSQNLQPLHKGVFSFHHGLFCNALAVANWSSFSYSKALHTCVENCK